MASPMTGTSGRSSSRRVVGGNASMADIAAGSMVGVAVGAIVGVGIGMGAGV